MQQSEIDNNFSYHEPTALKSAKYMQLREKGKELAEMINGLCFEGREKSLAMTKLEEAIMWANASIARDYTGGK
jgi:hypothetical protein